MITGSNLTNNQSSSSQSSYITDSVSPQANALIILTVINRYDPGTPNIPTASGAGLTFTQVTTGVANFNSHMRITVLRALSASPTPGAITIDFAGQSQSRINWSVEQFVGVDAGGVNGANAVVQSALNTTGASNGATVTLSAFSNAANATYDAMGEDISAPSAGSGFTPLGSNNSGTNFLSEWKNTNDTSVDFSWGGGATTDGLAAAIEIKAGTAKPRVSYFL